MAEESAKLRIPYIAAAQAQKHVTHNEAMTLLDTLVQLSVLDKDLTAPPGSSSEGDCYIVAGGGGTATGAWAGWEKRVARFIDGEWRSYLPGEGAGAGWLAWVLDEDVMVRFDGTNWQPAGIEGPPGPSLKPDAVVNGIAGRDDYDDEAAAFAVLVVADASNDGLTTLYYKLSAATADWSDPVSWPEAGGGAGAAQRGHLWGLTLANNTGDATNDLDITVGEAADSTGAVLIKLTSGLTKRLDADWGAGTNQGGRYSGAAIANTTYFVYLVAKSDGADADIYLHPYGSDDATVLAHLQAETGGSAYLYARRIGAILRTSGAIRAFTQDGDYFRLAPPTLDVSVSNQGTSSTLRTLDTPLGLSLRVKMDTRTQHASGSLTYIRNPDDDDSAPLAATSGRSTSTSVDQQNQIEVYTNTSAQVATRSSSSSTSIWIAPLGWFDTRGKEGN